MKRFILVFSFLLFLTVSANAVAKFAVCTTTCTWDNASTAMWSLSSGGATGAAVPSSADTVTFDAATCVGGTTCTTTLNFGGTITVQSLTLGACTASTTGCIFDNSVNNNNITMTLSGTALSLTGTGTRNIKFGSATYILSGANGSLNATTTTNMTFTAGTSDIRFTGNNLKSLTSFGINFATVTIPGPGGSFTINSNATITTWAVTGPVFIQRDVSNTPAVTNPITWVGTPSSPIGIATGTLNVGATINLAVGSTISWASLRDFVVLTAGRTTCNNCLDVGGNSNVTFVAPSAGGTGTCILGGWLLWRDMPEHINDNFPAWMDKAA